MPAQMPAANVPSRLNNGMPRNCVQPNTSTVAIAERAADWISGGMSTIASLIVTLLKPQLRHSPIVTMIASASSGRDDGAGGTGVLLFGRSAVDYAHASDDASVERVSRRWTSPIR